MNVGSLDQMGDEANQKNGIEQDGMDSDKCVTKKDLDESFDSLGSLYSERSKKRRYKGKKDKKTGVTGRTWTKLEDPHAPRKPRSAYVHFLSSRRANYGTVKQGCDQKSINVALAAEWQALSPEDREVFRDYNCLRRLYSLIIFFISFSFYMYMLLLL
uniref:HMG box domain-containing protein n=1 Tax=Heterorhabditis bacteriophora TaxID=37862 RepID=A0A1I7W8W6_HETBA